MKPLILGVFCLFAMNTVVMHEDANSREEFDRKFYAWKEYISQPEVMTSSVMAKRFQCSEFKELVDMGLVAVPYMVEKIPECDLIVVAIATIAKLNIKAEYDEKTKTFIFPDYPNLKPGENVYEYWWRNARRETPTKFAEFYTRWKTLSSQGESSQAKESLRQMRNLGVAALPVMVHRIGQGEQELVALVSELTGGKVDPNAGPAECLSWWENNREKWLITFPNAKPVAEAGPDRAVTSGGVVQLDASSSNDPDGDELSYHWTQVTGPAVSLSDSTAVAPTFVAPVVREQTVLVFQLVVDDAGDLTKALPTLNSNSDPAIVRITVRKPE